jgi:hypothetical protein
MMQSFAFVEVATFRIRETVEENQRWAPASAVFVGGKPGWSSENLLMEKRMIKPTAPFEGRPEAIDLVLEAIKTNKSHKDVVDSTKLAGRLRSPLDVAAEKKMLGDGRWQWLEQTWSVVKGEQADEDGWMYAFDWASGLWQFSNKKTKTSFVRKRHWSRERIWVGKGTHIVADAPEEDCIGMGAADTRIRQICAKLRQVHGLHVSSAVEAALLEGRCGDEKEAVFLAGSEEVIRTHLVSSKKKHLLEPPAPPAPPSPPEQPLEQSREDALLAALDAVDAQEEAILVSKEDVDAETVSLVDVEPPEMQLSNADALVAALDALDAEEAKPRPSTTRADLTRQGREKQTLPSQQNHHQHAEVQLEEQRVHAQKQQQQQQPQQQVLQEQQELQLQELQELQEQEEDIDAVFEALEAGDSYGSDVGIGSAADAAADEALEVSNADALDAALDAFDEEDADSVTQELKGAESVYLSTVNMADSNIADELNIAGGVRGAEDDAADGSDGDAADGSDAAQEATHLQDSYYDKAAMSGVLAM